MNATSFTPLDQQFGELMMRLADQPSPELHLAARWISHSRGEGHTCLSLAGVAAQAEEEIPPIDNWIRKLRNSGVVGFPGDFMPLILDASGRLYLRRYWEYEARLARMIRERLTAPPPQVDLERLRLGLNRCFPKKRGATEDWQRVAAFAALTGNFCVISGGPGTGKTRTVVTILALLLEQNASIRVALAAPTGKAAARLKESIQTGRRSSGLDKSLMERFPEEATTIHRLLGTIPGSTRFRYNAERPLALDVVIVDEASMVDLALMTKLFEALPPHARIILLGDKDQLASVEAGSVLGDICNTGASIELSEDFWSAYRNRAGSRSGLFWPIQDAIVELRDNFRFSSDSGIFRVSQAIKEGNAEEVLDLVRSSSEVTLRPLAGKLEAGLRKPVVSGYGPCLGAGDPAKMLEHFRRFRVLCAHRRGRRGAEGLNVAIEQLLEDAGLLRKDRPWYHGRPVMIMRNDYNLRLFNGDTGVTFRDEAGEARVHFATAEGDLRQMIPGRLPAHETTFAMTVHKSQGSEFDRVMLVLPEADSPVLTRELLYTAVTRAREAVEIRGDAAVLRAAVERRTRRTSGLREALWGSA